MKQFLFKEETHLLQINQIFNWENLVLFMEMETIENVESRFWAHVVSCGQRSSTPDILLPSTLTPTTTPPTLSPHWSQPNKWKMFIPYDYPITGI